MTRFSEGKRIFLEVAATISRAAPSYSHLLLSPSTFYWERSRDPLRRVSEAATLLLANSMAMAFIYYFALRSIRKVDHWIEYSVGAVGFCALFAILVSLLYAACSKAASASTPFLTHLCNAVCATSVMPWLSLATFRLHVRQAQAWLQDSHPALSMGDLLVLAGYVWLSWQVYVGLRRNAQAPVGRAAVAAVCGCLLALISMQTNIIPDEMSLLRVWTT